MAKGLGSSQHPVAPGKIAALRDPTVDDLFAKIAGARSHIADASLAKNHDSSALFSELDELNYQEQSLARTLTDRGFRPKTAPVTWQQVAAALGPDEAAIEFLDTGKSYLALVLTPTRHGIVLLGDERLVNDEALAAYRAEVGLGGRARKETFYDIVWKLLVPLLKLSRVYVASDGVLDQIPLDAVADDGGKLLMRDYEIRRVASTRVLAEKSEQPAPGKPTAVLVGDPLYYPAQPDARTCAYELPSSRGAPVAGARSRRCPARGSRWRRPVRRWKRTASRFPATWATQHPSPR